MSYENEQHLRGVDPLVNLAYCAASNLANINDASRGNQHAATVFEMGVQRLDQLGKELGVLPWPTEVGALVETYYEGVETGVRYTPLSGAVLPAAMIAAAEEVPVPQGQRLLRAVEAAIVTDRVAGVPVAQAAILRTVQPQDGRQFGPRYDLHEAYLDSSVYHYPTQVWDGVKGVISGAAGFVGAVRFAMSEGNRGDDSVDPRTFGY